MAGQAPNRVPNWNIVHLMDEKARYEESKLFAPSVFLSQMKHLKNLSL